MRRRPNSSRLLGLWCALSVAAWSSAAIAAEPSEAERRAAAEAIYATASELLLKGDFAAACPKFEEVVKLQPNGIGARLTLADCYVGQGKLASAHTTYGQVASMAAIASQSARAADAKQKAEALTPKLSHLTIVVAPEVAQLPGLSVMRGGLTVSSSLFNVPIPVDAGEYTIVADAQGKSPFVRSVKVTGNGTTATIVLSFTPPKSGGAGESSIGSTLPDGQLAAGRAAPKDEGSMAPVRIGGLVLGSIGLALAGVGIGVGVARSSSASDFQAQHDVPGTSARDQKILSDAYVAASTEANAGWAMTGIGGAAAVAGLIMIIAAPDEPTVPATPGLSVVYGVGPGSLWLSGEF